MGSTTFSLSRRGMVKIKWKCTFVALPDLGESRGGRLLPANFLAMLEFAQTKERSTKHGRDCLNRSLD